METLFHIVLVLVPMILSLSVHEYAHARSALWLGDDTATRAGRLTLNPISHIDIIGTLVLPIFIIVSGSSIFFGWAKPVPVSPVRFTRRFGGKRVMMGTGMAITAAAGPLSNIAFGLLAAVILKVLIVAEVYNEIAYTLLLILIRLNFVLSFFNFLPIPPLDGSKVLARILPASIGKWFEYLETNTFLSFIVLMALLGSGVLGYILGPILRGMLYVTAQILDLPILYGGLW